MKGLAGLKNKKFFINASKILFVILLLSWLAWSGKLDFKQLNILYKRPDILLSNIFIWLVCSLFIGGFRWFLLLKGQNLHIKYFQVLKLQLIGFFFNTAVPGAVGGDIIKAVYVIRGLQSDRKTPAMLTILLDRVFGLSALFFLSAIAMLFNLDFFLSKPILFPLIVFILGGTVAIILGLVWVLFLSDRISPFSKINLPKLPGTNIILGVYNALKVYTKCPSYIFYAIGLGILIQLCSVANAWYLTSALTGSTPEFGNFMAVFAVGIMTTALPLAPGGLGVGHVAFEKLFRLIDLTNGANVFNIIVLVQLILNLSGFIPYLGFKSLNLLPKDESLESLTGNSTNAELSPSHTCK